MHPMTVKKEELKALGKKIRELKRSRKGTTPEDCWKIQSEISVRKRTFRHEFIAYCLVRGRTYEQIEQKCREDNKPDFVRIKILQDHLQIQVNEANAEWTKLHQKASNE